MLTVSRVHRANHGNCQSSSNGGVREYTLSLEFSGDGEQVVLNESKKQKMRDSGGKAGRMKLKRGDA